MFIAKSFLHHTPNFIHSTYSHPTFYIYGLILLLFLRSLQTDFDIVHLLNNYPSPRRRLLQPIRTVTTASVFSSAVLTRFIHSILRCSRPSVHDLGLLTLRIADSHLPPTHTEGFICHTDSTDSTDIWLASLACPTGLLANRRSSHGRGPSARHKRTRSTEGQTLTQSAR